MQNLILGIGLGKWGTFIVMMVILSFLAPDGSGVDYCGGLALCDHVAGEFAGKIEINKPQTSVFEIQSCT